MVVTERSKLSYAVIDAERCKACRFCISFCPKNIIGLASRINRGGYLPAEIIEEKASECTGCANCAVMCPDIAISIYRNGAAPHKSQS